MEENKENTQGVEKEITVEKELNYLCSVRENYNKLSKAVHGLWIRHGYHNVTSDDPLAQLQNLEKVLIDLRAENSMFTSRVRGLLATVSHLGHYMDKEELNYRDIIRKFKDDNEELQREICFKNKNQ